MLFVATTFDVRSQKFDYRVLKHITEQRNSAWDVSMNKLTISSDYVAIASPIGLTAIGLLKKDKELTKSGIQMGLAVFGTYSVGYLLKKSINRNRPYTDFPNLAYYQIENDASFPSGSTSVAFSTATSLTLAYPKWYVAVPSYTWASAVGYSRLHLGVHYPTDVLAGAAIGVGSAFVSKKLMKWINK